MLGGALRRGAGAASSLRRGARKMDLDRWMDGGCPAPHQDPSNSIYKYRFELTYMPE